MNLEIELKQNLPSITRVIEILSVNAKKQIERNMQHFTAFDLGKSIEFRNVSFKYNERDKFELKDISFFANRGEKIAIVGASGSGKSTLMKLLTRMYPPDSGQVLIDGVDISCIDEYEYHKNIGIVMQDALLFNLSIKENLLIAKPDATIEEMDLSCERACIKDFIYSLPGGYDTIIGERGVKLSAGQKQRMAIARVLLANPGIIIFDEATSSLDHESEKMINKAIEEISKDKIIIIVAHRLSSIIKADKIVLIDNGEIAGIGKHDELIEDNGVYQRIFGEQYTLSDSRGGNYYEYNF